MIRIAICDDDIKELAYTRSILDEYIQEHPQYEIKLYLFSATLELLYCVEEQGGFDIYLLDVYMPDMLGTEAARELRKLDDKGEIIFLTTSRNHAIEAFEVDAAQYLIKPYGELAIFTAIDKVLIRLNVERRHIITIKTSDGMVRLFSRDVLFTQPGKNNYQVIHMLKGEKFLVRMTSTELFVLLSQSKNFARCGASINLNLRYVRQIMKDNIIFDTGERLAYPYRAYQKLKDEFLSFQMSIEE